MGWDLMCLFGVCNSVMQVGTVFLGIRGACAWGECAVGV